MKPVINIVDGNDSLVDQLSDLIKSKCLKKNTPLNMGVSGGSMPQSLCAALQRLPVDFVSKINFVFCDERRVVENDPDSTFGAYEIVICNSGFSAVSTSQFVRINHSLPVDTCATDYESKLRKMFPDVEFPVFDMLFLGLGPDGHTCSLFPGHPLLEENKKWVAPIDDSPKPPPERVTLTLPVLNNAAVVVFITTGVSKSDAVRRIINDNENSQDLPGARVRPKSNELYWFLDKDAASKL